MKVNVGVEPGLLSICPTPSPPGPYILMARSRGSGGIRHRLQYRHTVRTRISTSITIGPSLTGLRGTQLTGSIIYTLVRKKAEVGFCHGCHGMQFLSQNIHNDTDTGHGVNFFTQPKQCHVGLTLLSFLLGAR
jgi:hypothetical protein